MSIVSEYDERLVFVLLEKAIIPPVGIIEHLKDKWWCIHSEKGLIFWDKKIMSPQCNSNESIAKQFIINLYPWARCEFIPSVFRRVDPHDYL